MNRFLVLIALLIITACSKNDRVNNCNYLLNVSVSASVNMNLPQYSQLQFTSNSVYIANQGNAGIIVTNVGNSSFRAWDAADPNHTPTSCSKLTITGANATCGCQDANEYSLFTGQSIGVNLPCGLKEYRVGNAGNNTLLISN
ncbi:MAG: hypothetical protein R2783_08665 [Gelidibacter sp.]